LSVWYPVRQLSKKYTSVLLVLITCMFASCSSNENQFMITGKFKDMPAGQLYIYNQEDSRSQLDTLFIKNGKFAYVGVAENVTPYVLVFPNALEQVIFAQNGYEINYSASANDLKNYQVDGSEENELMNQFRQQTKGLNPAQTQEIVSQFIDDNIASPVAVYLFDRYYVQESIVDLATLKAKLKAIKKSQPTNHYVMKIENQLKQIERGQLGKKMPDINLTMKSKRQVNLSTVEADYTVLVYWATWLPHLYDFIDEFDQLTEDYREDEQVQFIAISLDTEVYRWEHTLHDDTVRCEHVCEGRAWESTSVKQLGVTSVPTFIIADKQHKIIAKGQSISQLADELDRIVH